MSGHYFNLPQRTLGVPGAGIPEPGQMGGSRAANACGMPMPTLGHARYTQDSRSARGFTCAGELSRGVGLRGFEIGLRKGRRASHSPHQLSHAQRSSD